MKYVEIFTSLEIAQTSVNVENHFSFNYDVIEISNSPLTYAWRV